MNKRPSRHRFRKLAIATGLSLAWLAAASVAHADEAMNAKAEQLFEEARRFRQEERWSDCVASATAAWALQEHPAIAGVLGHCALETERYAEAATYLERYLAAPPESAGPEAVAFVRGQLEFAQKHVARVSFRCNVEGAAIFVDGKPQPPESLYLAPGSHKFEAHAEGYRSVTFALDLQAAASREVVLDLVPLGSAPAPVPEPHGEDPSGGEQARPLWPIGVLAPLAAAGLGIGIGFTVGALGKQTDAKDLAQQIRDASAQCQPTPSPGFEARCVEYADLADQRDVHRTAGIVGFVVGGASLAAVTGYLVWALSGPAAGEISRVRPLIGPGAAGVELRF